MRPPLEVTITGPRGDEWERACGTRTFPVTTWEPVRADLPDKPNAQVWMVDIERVDSATLGKIVEHLSQKFGVPVLKAAISAHGIPILAEDAFVVLNDPQRWVG